MKKNLSIPRYIGIDETRKRPFCETKQKKKELQISPLLDFPF